MIGYGNSLLLRSTFIHNGAKAEIFYTLLNSDRNSWSNLPEKADGFEILKNVRNSEKNLTEKPDSFWIH